MTTSQHSYMATLPGGRAVPPRGGSIALSAAQAPHCQATLDIPLPGRWDTVPDTLGPWRELRRNLHPNPVPRGLGALSVANGAVLSDAGDAVDVVCKPGVRDMGLTLVAWGVSAPSTVYTLSAEVEWLASAGGVRFSVQGAAMAGAVGQGSTELFETGERRRIALTFTTAVSGAASAYLLRGSATASERFRVRAMSLEVGQEQPFIHPDDARPSTVVGDMVTVYRHRWLGAINASASVLEAASVTSHGGPVWTPDPAALEQLDPRVTPRVVITASDGTTSRDFDLGVRDIDVSQREGVVTVSLASDEALLLDYAPLADDLTAWHHQASLRAVVNYVLGRVIPGAALQAAPAHDADVSAFWSVTNRVYNPACEGIWGYSLGLNAKGLGTSPSGGVVGTKFVWWQSNAAGWSYCIADGDSRCIPGQWITGAAHLTSSSGTLQAHAVLRFFDAGGNIMVDIPGPAVTNLGAFPRATVTAQVPPGAASVKLVAGFRATAANQTLGWDALLLVDGQRVVPYFDGGTPDDPRYVYEWSGDAYASPSTRLPVLERSPDALRWAAGQSALEFLGPLVQAAGLRLVCDELRRWTLRDEHYSAPGVLTVRQGINMVDGGYRVSRDEGLWYDAAVTLWKWTDPHGTEHERVEAFALNTPHTRAVTFEKFTAYPGPGFTEYAVRRAQGKGREVTATTVADWTANAEQLSTIILDSAPPQVGRTTEVTFDLDRDEMTVTTRTTDTPLGAVDLLPGTINALTGAINDL